MIDRAGQLEYFPGTTEIVPAVLTPLEAARFLRLDSLTKISDGELVEEPRADADAVKSLEYVCRAKGLRPRRFGKSKTYTRTDLLTLIHDNSVDGEGGDPVS